MYKIIFDSMTTDSMKKFLKITHDDEIKKNQHKDIIAKEINKKILEDDDFRNRFNSYYKQIEKAGRKDFWFTKLKKDLSAEELNKIRNKIKTIPREINNIYVPKDLSDIKYYNVSENANVLEFKVIRRKVISEKDESKTRSSGNYLYVAYKQTEIRHVSYFRLDLSKGNKLLIGVDVWQNLSTKRKLEEVQKDIKRIFGTELWDNINFIDIKESANRLLDSGNVITKQLNENITDRSQSAQFSIDVERVNVIKKALNTGTVNLEDIKTVFISDDIKDNEVYQAARSKDIAMLIKGGKAALFYHSASSNEYECFRMEVYATESRIKILNDHIMFEDLKNVFPKIN